MFQVLQVWGKWWTPMNCLKSTQLKKSETRKSRYGEYRLAAAQSCPPMFYLRDVFCKMTAVIFTLQLVQCASAHSHCPKFGSEVKKSRDKAQFWRCYSNKQQPESDGHYYASDTKKSAIIWESKIIRWFSEFTINKKFELILCSSSFSKNEECSRWYICLQTHSRLPWDLEMRWIWNQGCYC